jgi:hypothetical protein
LNTPVAEYPFYKTRLRDIDWKAAEQKITPFEDPYFKADISSIYESNLPKRAGIESWQEFEWRRPSEVFGENGFSLYDTIDPNDIK